MDKLEFLKNDLAEIEIGQKINPIINLFASLVSVKCPGVNVIPQTIDVILQEHQRKKQEQFLKCNPGK